MLVDFKRSNIKMHSLSSPRVTTQFESECKCSLKQVPYRGSKRDNQPVNNNRVPFVFTFHPALPDIRKTLHRLHPVLKSSRLCQAAIEQVPMVAFRRPQNLKDILVHSEMKMSVTDRCSCRCGDLQLQKI